MDLFLRLIFAPEKKVQNKAFALFCQVRKEFFLDLYASAQEFFRRFAHLLQGPATKRQFGHYVYPCIGNGSGVSKPEIQYALSLGNRRKTLLA
jgi:hypothetical protein